MILLRKHTELIFWTMALVLLLWMDPYNHGTSLCLSTALGLGNCPGCGLGHSISFALHGKFFESFQAHPLGIFAIGVISWRMYKLIYLNFKNLNHG